MEEVQLGGDSENEVNEMRTVGLDMANCDVSIESYARTEAQEYSKEAIVSEEDVVESRKIGEGELFSHDKLRSCNFHQNSRDSKRDDQDKNKDHTSEVSEKIVELKEIATSETQMRDDREMLKIVGSIDAMETPCPSGYSSICRTSSEENDEKVVTDEKFSDQSNVDIVPSSVDRMETYVNDDMKSSSNEKEHKEDKISDCEIPLKEGTQDPEVSNYGDTMAFQNENVVLKGKSGRSKKMRYHNSDKLMTNLNEMRKENFLCDVELEAAGGTIFKAHRSVLVAACAYFRAMFSSGLLEGQQSRVKMEQISPTIMSTILEFIYTGDLQVGLDEVQDLMVVADMLQMEDVIDGCTQLMYDEIEPSNALGIYRFAEAHNCTAMAKMAETYVKQNFLEVVKSDEFVSLPLCMLNHFLSSEGLEVDSEMQVFESAVRWLFHNPPQRRQHVLEVLSHVRLGLLHPDLMSLRAWNTIHGRDPPLGVALAAIRMEVEDRAKGQHLRTRHEDVPRRGAKKHIVVLGGCRREPFPSPYRYASQSYSSSHLHGEVLCAAVEVFDVFHKEWLGQGGTSHLRSSEARNQGTPPLLNPRILPGVATMGGIIYVVGGELESQILANVEALDARACLLRKGIKAVEEKHEGKEAKEDLKECSVTEEDEEENDVDADEGGDEDEDDDEEDGKKRKRSKGEEEGVVGEGRGEKRRNEEVEHEDRGKRGCHLDPFKWVSSMVNPRCEFGLCECGGRLYAIGGWVGSDVDSSVESYDPIIDEWHLEGNLPKAFSGMSAISYEGLIYVVGGCMPDRRHLASLFSLAPPNTVSSNSSNHQKASSWCSQPVYLASMSTPRSQMGAAVLHDSLYVVGGTNRGSDALRSVERYSFAENKWYEVTPLREPRCTPSVVSLDGRLYAIGGTTPYHKYHYKTQISLKSVEMYDPISDTWSPMPSLPHARGEAGAVVI